jgi:hypothetical protein
MRAWSMMTRTRAMGGREGAGSLKRRIQSIKQFSPHSQDWHRAQSNGDWVDPQGSRSGVGVRREESDDDRDDSEGSGQRQSSSSEAIEEASPARV